RKSSRVATWRPFLCTQENRHRLFSHLIQNRLDRIFLPVPNGVGHYPPILVFRLLCGFLRCRFHPFPQALNHFECWEWYIKAVAVFLQPSPFGRLVVLKFPSILQFFPLVHWLFGFLRFGKVCQSLWNKYCSAPELRP